MSMNLVEIESLIKEALPDAIVQIQDLAGDGNHYSATVTSSAFKGKIPLFRLFTIEFPSSVGRSTPITA